MQGLNHISIHCCSISHTSFRLWLAWSTELVEAGAYHSLVEQYSHQVVFITCYNHICSDFSHYARQIGKEFICSPICMQCHCKHTLLSSNILTYYSTVVIDTEQWDSYRRVRLSSVENDFKNVSLKCRNNYAIIRKH